MASSFLIVLEAFAFSKGTPGDSRAAEIMKHALLSAGMLYAMYLAGGKEVFKWEKGSLRESIWLYKSMLIINFGIVVFTFIGFCRSVRNGAGGLLDWTFDTDSACHLSRSV